MRVLDREGLRRGGLPPGAQVLELVEGRTECTRHLDLVGMECVPERELVMVADRYRQGEPLVLHCGEAERCLRAGAELARLGYRNVLRYEGELADLEPYASGLGAAGEEFAVLLSREGLRSLLAEAGLRVTLLAVVNHDIDCPLSERVRCGEARDVEEALVGMDRENTLVLHCEENISYRAMVRRLHEAGFRDIRVLEEGFER